jgi:hypothetical protein
VRPLQVVEPELRDEPLGPPDLLVDLDHAAGAEDAELGMVPPHPSLRLRSVGLDDDHRVIGPDIGPGLAAEGIRETRADAVPTGRRRRRVQGQLAGAGRRGIAVDGDACAVGPAVRHLDEHRRGVEAELRLHVGRLGEETDDSAHRYGEYLHAMLRDIPENARVRRVGVEKSSIPIRSG